MVPCTYGESTLDATRSLPANRPSACPAGARVSRRPCATAPCARPRPRADPSRRDRRQRRKRHFQPGASAVSAQELHLGRTRRGHRQAVTVGKAVQSPRQPLGRNAHPARTLTHSAHHDIPRDSHPSRPVAGAVLRAGGLTRLPGMGERFAVTVAQRQPLTAVR